MKCVCCGRNIRKKDNRAYHVLGKRKRYSCWACNTNGSFAKWIDQQYPAKEFWKMTREEWFEHGQEHVRNDRGGTLVSACPVDGSTPRKPWGDSLHRFHIRQAIEAGQSVPDEVLTDYPDLLEVTVR